MSEIPTFQAAVPTEEELLRMGWTPWPPEALEWSRQNQWERMEATYDKVNGRKRLLFRPQNKSFEQDFDFKFFER